MKVFIVYMASVVVLTGLGLLVIALLAGDIVVIPKTTPPVATEQGTRLNDWAPIWVADGRPGIRIVRFEEGQLPIITGINTDDGLFIMGPALLLNEHPDSKPRHRFHFDDGRDLAVSSNAMVLIQRDLKLDRLVVQVVKDNTVTVGNGAIK